MLVIISHSLLWRRQKVQNLENIQLTLLYEKEKDQILTFKKQEPAIVWSFTKKKNIWNDNSIIK